jgi:hypothetical protein
MSSALALIPNSVPDVFKLAEALSNARGFVPTAYLSQPNAIAACILTGAELGMGPMESMREIHIVNGRPTLSSGAMLARAIRAGVGVEWQESSATAARLRLTRGATAYEQSWTLEDAKRAGLVGKSGPWQQYPQAMLRARCISAAVRAFCPDAIGGGGLYAPEEAADIAQAPQRVEVVEVAASAPAEPTRMVPRSLGDCRDAEQLRGWIAENRPMLDALTGAKRSAARDKLAAAAAELEIDVAPILGAAGLDN